MLSHAEAVPAFGVHVQLSGFVSVRPLLVQGDAVRRQSELIVACRGNEYRWRIGRNLRIFEHRCSRVNRRYKCGPAFFGVTQCDARCHGSSCREADNADLVRRNTPSGRMFAHVSYSC